MTASSPAPDPIELQVSLGLPGQQLWEHRIHYSHGAQSVVLSLVISKDQIPHSRIYIRHLDEERYRSAINAPSEDYSAEGAVLSEEPPYLFYVLSRWIRSGPDFANQYIGVGRLDLKTGADEVWETEKSAATPFFVVELAQTSSNGGVLYAVCGFRSEGPVGPVVYALAELDWQRRSVTTKAALRGPFF